ncbi:DctP family TRAP transporter solute-binding subunit [Rhizobium sp. SL86]|uniref:DctP family TRAP transporter solute-binding subunit n=1 Tax=Rhizobium sp. SL86 TaxID=2995148 RepID=UPI0022731E30|nr:DctP family TRAP transporter solute-binding subunit [Rhizobium sp. SL86]MCY1667198.1 DctP family TRAP transporter solute-binding subunit [Rhizobium sp. SL86]
MIRLWKVVALLALSLAVGLVPAEAQVQLKLAHAAPESDLQQILALFIQQEVSARSQGEMAVYVFPQGQLGNDAQMIEGAQAGVIDIVISGLNNFTGLVPEAAVFELPFIFPDRQAAYKVLDGPIGSSVAEKFTPHGLKLLGYPENGYRNITNNRDPIRKPEDLTGLQMRVNNAAPLNQMFTLFGAKTQQIPVTELYAALEAGLVDAQDHPLGIVLSYRFHEVQKYLSLTQHAYSPLAIMMSRKSFDGFKPEAQQMLLDVVKAAIDQQRRLSRAQEEEILSLLAQKGMIINRDVDTTAFQKAVRPVWDGVLKTRGAADLIHQILNASQ